MGALGAGAGLYESGKVRVHPTGGVTVYTGSHSHGQGHETTFSQLVADELGIPMEQIEIVHGDTGQIPFGMGTYGSRSASVGGTAIKMSLDKIKEKGMKIAAHLLEASPKDMEYANGQFQVKGVPAKAVPFGAVALTAYVPHNYPEGLEPGLEETSFYDPSNFCFPFGAHACVVEVEPETGKVKVLRYVAVDDVGNVISPMIVDGMVHGGVAQGIGQALWPARHRQHDGLRDAQGRHADDVRDGPDGHADAGQSARDKGSGRDGDDRRDARRRQRRRRCARRARRRSHRNDAFERRARVEDHSGRQGR